MMPRALWHYLGALYLAFQSMCALFWWLILAVEPRARTPFRPAGTPDSALLAFFLPDAILFVGAAMWAALALVKKPQSATLPLALHSGAATYAALYCLFQTILTGGAIWATIFMAPSAGVALFLLWKILSSKD